MKYYLVENKLTEDKNYIAKIQAKQTVSQEELIERMLSKRNLVSKTDILAVFNSLYEEVVGCIEEGENISLPLFNLSYSITGTYKNPEENFNPDTHKLHVNIRGGKLVKHVKKNIVLQKVDAPLIHPIIKNIKDLTTQTTNTYITPNGMFEMKGSRLKIAGTSPEVGVYFMTENGNEFKVPYLAQNDYKNIIGQIPNLDSGNYRIVIKTQATDRVNKFLKDVRINNSVLIVVVK
ncbi:conserved protein of unknown function [Tenacibaculum sp. 190524A02b]|uniref:HU family DNA-binding protein n=1 Tax=Tenacibaculum vairaonense TaxID=3137860 RepID=UPI0032B15B59